ncbi:MAG: Gfo/Idh/MocA family oxidoreductase [Pseudomonadota bacterium]
MSPDRLRVGVVGAGYFSQFHLGSWGRIAEADLVGICDADLAKAEAFGAPAFSDLSEMLTTAKPDLLDIVVPPVAHAACIRAAITAGVQWIICQKPFCRGLDEAREIVREAEEAGATIVVHENFRFQPWYRAIKASVAAGDIGSVLQATFRLRPGDGQGPRAYLDRQPYFQTMPRFLVHETAVHWIDTFRFLFGDPVAVYADLRRINPAIAGEDAGYVIFDHPGACKALFDGNRHLDHAADNLRRTMGEALIEGTAGSLHLFGDGSVLLRAQAATEATEILPPDRWQGFGGDCVHALQSHVASGILHQTGFENLAGAYLKVIEIEEAIYSSAAEGRKIRLADP